MTWILFVIVGYGQGAVSERIGPFSSEGDCKWALVEIKAGDIGKRVYDPTTQITGQCIMIDRHATNKEFD